MEDGERLTVCFAIPHSELDIYLTHIIYPEAIRTHALCLGYEGAFSTAPERVVCWIPRIQRPHLLVYFGSSCSSTSATLKTHKRPCLYRAYCSSRCSNTSGAVNTHFDGPQYNKAF